jgi:hypothetical protein
MITAFASVRGLATFSATWGWGMLLVAVKHSFARSSRAQ